MVNHEDSDVRNWARSIIEPFEICYISKDKDELGFNEWVIFTPWMCTNWKKMKTYNTRE